MKGRLHSTCRLADGVYWLLMRPDGTIYATSQCGFHTEREALIDLGILRRV